MLEFLPLIGGLFVVSGTIFMAQKNPLVWIMFSLANLIWIVYGALNSASGPMMYGIFLNIMNLIGALEWEKQDAIH